jgi:RNA polymerase sigma-70 factor (sigma-E family)
MRREVDEDFARYVRARQHTLLRAAYLVCGDAHLAEDLLQQAFAKLATRWERLRGENPDAYVRRILYHDAISSWRRTRREHVLEFVPEGGADDWGAGGLRVDESAAVAERLDLERALATLTPKQRAVVVLRYFEDRTEADTAEVLGVSVGTVKSQTHAALARLRERIPGLTPSLTGGEQP